MPIFIRTTDEPEVQSGRYYVDIQYISPTDWRPIVTMDNWRFASPSWTVPEGGEDLGSYTSKAEAQAAAIDFIRGLIQG